MITLIRLSDPQTSIPGNTYILSGMLTGGEIFCLLSSLRKNGSEVSKDIITKIENAVKELDNNESLLALAMV